MTSQRRTINGARLKTETGVPWFTALLLVLVFALAGLEIWRMSGSNGALTLSESSSLSSLGASRRGGASRKQLEAGPRHFPARKLKTLVLVACHSVYTGLDFSHPEDQSSWLLLDYQKVPGQTHSFLEHIKLGVEHAAADPDAMLLFSGGKTRKEAGPRAEAMGYWMLAEANDWFGHKDAVRQRAFTEEHARDSFENFMFGLCRFYELTGRYPESIVMVSYEFKRERFSELHRAALRWPVGRWQFVGTPALTPEAAEGEHKTAAAFEEDPYGCKGELGAKRAVRDPFADGGYAGERCPALSELLRYCGPGLFAGSLPWDAPAADALAQEQ